VAVDPDSSSSASSTKYTALLHLHTFQLKNLAHAGVWVPTLIAVMAGVGYGIEGVVQPEEGRMAKEE